MSISLDSFHTAFNARHLRPEDVAKSFIMNNDFEELIQNNHTVLLGARGCGKTTLMKMLTLPALYSWDNKKAAKIRKTIEFYSIYISTDIYWNAQKDAYNKQLDQFPKYAEIVSKVAVTTNVLFCLIETFEYIQKYVLKDFDQIKEIELSKILIDIWEITPTIPNLVMIKEALIKRTDHLNQHIQRTIFNCKSEEDIQLNQQYFTLNYDTSVLSAVTVFERIFSLQNDCKWALCFDELELAPLWLQERLFNSLRSRNQKILYKLSASPIVPVCRDILATPGNDFKLVKMWPHEGNNQYLNFSEELVNSILFKKFNIEVDPEVIFGSNQILKKDQNSYKEDGEIWEQIKELAETDNKLCELLLKHGIDPKNPKVTLDNSRKMDTVLRKIKPIVYFRNYYSTYDIETKKRKSRSRKSHSLFYGKEVLYKISDGNPRWLIGILNEMLLKGGLNNNKISKISEEKQAAVLENIAAQFFNVIRIIPEAVIQHKSKYLSLADVIKEIGEFFFNEIVLDDFQRDPHSTFQIDNSISDELIKILEKGVYQGAFILSNKYENSLDFEMREKVFRLSYLFAPMFKIPIRKYANLPLSKCLSLRTKTTSDDVKKDVITNQTEIKF